MDYPSSQSGEMIAQGAPFFDLLNPEFEYESTDVAEARERSWFASTPHGIIVLRHREGLELLRDRRFGLGSEREWRSWGLRAGRYTTCGWMGWLAPALTITRDCVVWSAAGSHRVRPSGYGRLSAPPLRG